MGNNNGLIFAERERQRFIEEFVFSNFTVIHSRISQTLLLFSNIVISADTATSFYKSVSNSTVCT